MPDRILKESICNSDTINELSPEAEVFFYRLIVKCDDYGRFDARPPILRSALYPLRTDVIKLDEILQWRNVIAGKGLIRLYKSGGKEYLEVTTWRKYQRVRADKSKYPDPEGNYDQSPSNPNDGLDKSIHEADGINSSPPSSADKCPQAHADAPVFVNENDNENDKRYSNNENDNENDGGASSSGCSSENNNLTTDDIVEITKDFEENVCKITSGVAVELNDALKNYTKPELLGAIRACALQNKHTTAYFLGVLRNKGNGARAAPTNKNKVDPDKYIKGKYGHMVQR